jgi:hypothetical protein
MNSPQDRLILIYNANGGILNGAKDTIWKVLSPSTYPCSLCALTFGWVSMHGAWRRFLDSLPQTKVFHHKDDYAPAFPDLDIALPAILLAEGDAPPKILVSAAELDALPDLNALIALVQARTASSEPQSR